MQRFFSSFPNGWPGAGLLVLRLAAAIPLMLPVIPQFQSALQPSNFLLPGAALVSGALVLLGLWTPFAAGMEILLELLQLFAKGMQHETPLLLSVLAASLIMLGPGAWSVDARLYGRRRLDL